MIVVGGVYGEEVVQPKRRTVIGSGLRAAAAISKATSVTLRTALTADELRPVRTTAATFGIGLEHTLRERPVSFTYETPLSRPYFDEPGTIVDIDAEDEVVLAFGMVDAKVSVRAARLVIDPQRPGLTDLRRHIMFEAPKVAIVANQWEVRSLEPESESLTEAARGLLLKQRAEVVVVKRGAMGALVVTATGAQEVGPFPTARVWPLGTGDVFSGVFAWAWGQQQLDPTVAARVAARATAKWVLSRGDAPVQVLSEAGVPLTPSQVVEVRPRELVVYLAGPFFNLGQRMLVDLARRSLKGLGARVFSPLHDVGHGKPNHVAPADIAGLDGAHSVLALLDGVDPGTLFEVGYSFAQAKPVVGFCEDPEAPDLTMLSGNGLTITADLPTAIYKAIWAGMQ